MKDIQNLKDNRGVDIQKVGIKDIEFPLVIQRKDEDRTGGSNRVLYLRNKKGFPNLWRCE